MGGKKCVEFYWRRWHIDYPAIIGSVTSWASINLRPLHFVIETETVLYFLTPSILLKGLWIKIFLTNHMELFPCYSEARKFSTNLGATSKLYAPGMWQQARNILAKHKASGRPGVRDLYTPDVTYIRSCDAFFPRIRARQESSCEANIRQVIPFQYYTHNYA